MNMKQTPGFRSMTSGQRTSPMSWRWWSSALTRTPLVSGLLLLAFLFAPALALGQATGPQPGATDPLDGPRGYA
ncbi:MAG: hypothetical protein ACREEM_55860, partial [Blastocatellia bacterium]